MLGPPWLTIRKCKRRTRAWPYPQGVFPGEKRHRIAAILLLKAGKARGEQKMWHDGSGAGRGGGASEMWRSLRQIERAVTEIEACKRERAQSPVIEARGRLAFFYFRKDRPQPRSEEPAR